MQWDRWLAIASAIIGLPSLFKSLQDDTALTSMGLAAAAILLFAAIWVRYRTNLPPFSFSRIETTVSIKDAAASSAHVVKAYKCRPNFSHLDFMRHRNIAADGPISNFKWNGQPLPAKDIEKEFGETIVTVRFGACLPAFKDFTGKLTYELSDSFPNTSESWTWVADFPTKIVIIKIQLPTQRPCKSYSGHVSVGGTERPVNSIVTNNDNCEIKLRVKRPKVGAEYKVIWTW